MYSPSGSVTEVTVPVALGQSAGINLTHLYHGRIPFVWYLQRDLGYVNKIYRGLAFPDDAPPDGTLNALHGTVESLQYMGPYIEYSIDVSGVSLNALSSEEFARGAAVLVTFRPQDIHLLPKTAGTV